MHASTTCIYVTISTQQSRISHFAFLSVHSSEALNQWSWKKFVLSFIHPSSAWKGSVQWTVKTQYQQNDPCCPRQRLNIITLVNLIIGIIWPLCRATPWPPGPSHPPSSQVISAMLPEICFRKHFHFLAFSFSATAAFILSEDTFPLSSFGLCTIRGCHKRTNWPNIVQKLTSFEENCPVECFY